MSKQGYIQIPVSEPTIEVDALAQKSRDYSRKSRLHALCYAILLISNIFFFTTWLNLESTECIRPQLSYSPARAVISYEKRRLMRDIGADNVYTGEPREEHDKAWGALIEPMTIKISQAELDILDDHSIALRDGSGYIGELAVYHELHCIKRIRRHLHLEHYYPNMTQEEKRKENIHIDHCLEYWREAAMCRGDATISTFRWGPELAYSTVYSDHECINWAKFDTWARSQMVDMSDYSILEPHKDEGT